VLVDSYKPHFEAWRRTAQQRGLTITDQQFAACFGRTGREFISALWSGQVTEEQAATLDAEKEVCYRQVLEESFPEMPGASRLLRELHRAGFALAIGSSGPPENVELVVRQLPAGSLFSATVHGMEVNAGKPDPAVFLLAARKLGRAPYQCAVIEDAPAGIQAGRRAGMSVIALTGTGPRGKLDAAHMVVDSLLGLSAKRIAGLIDHHAAAAGKILS